MFLCSALVTFAVGPYYVATDGNDTTGTGTIASPFATLNKAREVVATVNKAMTSDIYVYVRGGTYYQTATVNFTTNDSGSNGRNIIYQAYTNEIPVFSGGTNLTGWTFWTNINGKAVYKASIGTGFTFRQLYVNGRRAIRARTPNAGSFAHLISWNTNSQTITVNTADVGGINTNGVEMVIARYWTQNRLRVNSCVPSGSTTTLGFLNPESGIAFSNSVLTMATNQTYYLENSLALLDSEDEWYLGPGGILYYMPVADEPITDSTVIAPKIDTLIRLQGTSLIAPIRNVKFMGLTFAHTTWNAPDNEGYNEAQAGISWNANPPITAHMASGVWADKADFLLFEANTFVHMGGQALTFYSACHTNTIRGNTIHDISGNGISVDQALVKEWPVTAKTSSDNNIWNNYIYDCAADYWGSVGIFGGYVKNTKVAFNEVAYLPYTGISIGWGWTTNDNPAMTNSIQYNHIHHVVDLLEDGAAGIYTLSKQPGTLIAQNYIHDIRRSPWTIKDHCVAAIHLDNGSSCITVTNNVILPVERRVSQNFGGQGAHDNIISGNDSLNSGVVDNAGPQSAYLPSPINPTLVAYWKMETNTGTVTDASGHGNDGTIVGSVTTAAGLCGKAIHFDGSAEVVVPDSPDLRLQRFTICAWIKPDVALSQMPLYPLLVSKQNGTNGYILGNLQTNNTWLGIRFHSATTQQTIYNEPSSNNWVHVAGTYDGQYLRIYRNGVLESELAVTSTAISHDTTQLLIGYHFQGLMDEVRVYNEVLPTPDIRTLVDMKIDSNLIARWPMDSGNPYCLSDVSGNKNHGVLNPNTTVWSLDRDNQFYLSFLGGAAQAVTVPDSTTLRVQNHTIAAWVLPATNFNMMVCASPILVSKQDYPVAAGYHLGMLGSFSTAMGNRILNGNVYQTTYSEPSAGNWIHVVGTYDGSALTIYKNGVAQSTNNIGAQTIAHNAHDLLIGYGYEGIMRDVRIYNRALSATEVQLIGP